MGTEITSRTWRLRTCPRCGYEGPASGFGLVGKYRPRWHGEPAERSCPECGYVGETDEFKATDLRPAWDSVGQWSRIQKRRSRRAAGKP